MNFFANFILIAFMIFEQYVNAQCPPTFSNTAITGLYTADVNPASGSVIYIAPTATVTGNINLNNASLYNCGLILSPKITMKTTASIYFITLENNGTIKTDSIVMDSLSHFHNNDTLICKSFEVTNGSQVSNMYLMELGSLAISDQSFFDSNGLINANTFELKGPSSVFYNQYGIIKVRKKFENFNTCALNGVIFMCVDSCFINNGAIHNSAMNTWSPFINVNGISENNGIIDSPNFCDMSSTNGGMLDVNTGTVNITSYCSSQQYSCNYTDVGIKYENSNSKINIYPNPTYTTLNINDDSHLFQNSLIEIKNCIGQTVFESEFSNQIDVSSLAKGIYFLSIQYDLNKKIVKFIKE